MQMGWCADRMVCRWDGARMRSCRRDGVQMGWCADGMVCRWDGVRMGWCADGTV